MNRKEIKKAMTEGIVFRKASSSDPSGEKRPKLADFMRGTHGSSSARHKASFKLKRALRPSQRKK